MISTPLCYRHGRPKDLKSSESASLFYTSLVLSNLAYRSQLPWASQALNLILDTERIQPRATNLILSQLYWTEVTYKKRLLKTGPLPLCYWHEFLDLVYFFKCLVGLSDSLISVMNRTVTRSTDSSEGTLLTTVRNRTVFTAEPKNLENFTIPSSEHKLFSCKKKERFYYLLYLAGTVYDVNNPQRVCVSIAHTLVGY